MFAPPKGARLCSFFKQRVQESDVEKERVMLVGFVQRGSEQSSPPCRKEPELIDVDTDTPEP